MSDMCTHLKLIHHRQVMEAFYTVIEQFYPGDTDKQAEATIQLAAFRSKTGAQWNRSVMEAAAKRMPAHMWWQQFGSHAPELQHIAVRLLSQISSACACERNWSSFDFIHSRRRNQLHVERAFKLVYIFTNLRLLDKDSTTSFHERFPEWRQLAQELGSETEESEGQPQGSSSANSSIA